MAKLVSSGKGLKRLPEHAAVEGSFVGMAHIAGTGPDGETCRTCAFWGLRGAGASGEPARFAGGKRKGELKDSHCHKPVRHKADRVVPHDVRACRLFEKNEQAPAAVIR